MKKKYIIGAIILLLNITFFVIIFKSYNLKYDKMSNVYNKQIEEMNNELDDLKNNKNEINIDGHTHSFSEWKKINNEFSNEFEALLYWEYFGRLEDFKNRDLVEDDYFRYKYITYRLFNEDQFLSTDVNECFNCHYIDMDLLKKDYKDVFGFELYDNIIKKHAYKIENGKVYNPYNIGGGGHYYTIKFNNVENMKTSKKYTFDFLTFSSLNVPSDEINKIATDQNMPFFNFGDICKTKIFVEYDNDNHLKSFIIKDLYN